MANPCIYQDGQHGRSYQAWHFWCNILDAIWQSLAIYFITYLIFISTNIGIWEFGLIQMNILITVTLVHLAIEFKHWTVFQLGSLLVSYFVFWLAFMLIYHAVGVTGVKPECPYWIIYNSMAGAHFWLCLLLIIPAALLPRFAANALWNCVNPTMAVAAAIFIQKGKYARGEKMHFLERYLKNPKMKRGSGRNPKSRDTLELHDGTQSEMLNESQSAPFFQRLKQLFSTGFQLVRAVPGISLASQNQEAPPNPRRSDSKNIRAASKTVPETLHQKGIATVRGIAPAHHRRVQSYSDDLSVVSGSPINPICQLRRSDSTETPTKTKFEHINSIANQPVPYSALLPKKNPEINPSTRL